MWNVCRVWGRERGQVLVLAALLATALLGLIGLLVDAGSFYAERRQVQNTADEAALAAAHELDYGSTVTAARTAAFQNAAANGFNNNGTSNTVTVNIPPSSGEHVGDAKYAEVIVGESPKTFFIHVLVPGGGSVQARGVGGSDSGLGGALFAGENDCANDRTIHIEGTGIVINGGVHSNGSLKMGGTNNSIAGGATYVCDFDIDPTDTIDTVSQVGVKPWPVFYTYSDFTSAGCLFTVSGLMIIDASTPQYWLNNDPSTRTLKSGIFCSTGGIKLAETNVTGNVTFASQGKVELDSAGAGFNLTAYWNDILLFSDSTDPVEAIEVGGANGTWTGILHAPRGGVKFGGTGHVSIRSMVVAARIKFDGGAGVQLSAGDFAGGGVSLVE